MDINIKSQAFHIGVLTLSPTSLINTYVKDHKYTAEPSNLSSTEVEEMVHQSTFIDINYLNFVRLGNMVPVPILLYSSEEETVHQLESLNGIILTGGAESMYTNMEFQSETSTHYQQRILFLLNHIKKINDSGRYFFIFSICLGYESTLSAQNNNKNMLKVVDHQVKTYKPQILIKDAESTLFGSYLGKDIELLQEPIHYFYHKYGVLLEDFYEYKNISEEMRPLSFIHLDNGYNVLTCAEYISYPFFLFLSHPEKIEPIADETMEIKRLLWQNRVAKFMRYILERHGCIEYESKVLDPGLVLGFHNNFGTRYFYTDKGKMYNS